MVGGVSVFNVTAYKCGGCGNVTGEKGGECGNCGKVDGPYYELGIDIESVRRGKNR